MVLQTLSVFSSLFVYWLRLPQALVSSSSSSSSSSCSWRVRHVSLFLDPQDEVGPSISSSVVLCIFVRLVCIVVLVLVVCLCPSSVHAVATFPGTVLFPLLCSVLLYPFKTQCQVYTSKPPALTLKEHWKLAIYYTGCIKKAWTNFRCEFFFCIGTNKKFK